MGVCIPSPVPGGLPVCPSLGASAGLRTALCLKSLSTGWGVPLISGRAGKGNGLWFFHCQPQHSFVRFGGGSGVLIPDTQPGSQGSSLVDPCRQSLVGFLLISAEALACFCLCTLGSFLCGHRCCPAARMVAPVRGAPLTLALTWLSPHVAEWRFAQVQKPCDEGPWQMQQALVSPGIQASSCRLFLCENVFGVQVVL